MNRTLRRWLAAVALLSMLGVACAADQVKFGILAYRPKPQVQAQWAPLAAALNEAIPSYSFVLDIYNFKEMQAAVEARNVDFVLLNPGAYVLLQHRSGLSEPLVTLRNLEQGQPVSSFGGVIFTLATRSDIRDLKDLRGKTVATTSTESLGGYQMQAYELAQAGFRLPEDIRLVQTEMPHDKVVEAVFNERADAGFVRSGVLEDMAAEGQLNLADLKIVNRQHVEFPAALSTRLYPEWPLAALPHTDKELKRKVAAFMLRLEDDTRLAQSLRIHGFDVPSAYAPVENLLRELRLPPFDISPAFTLLDVWKQYRWLIASAILGAALLVLLAFRLLLSNRQLKIEKNIVQRQAAEIKKSESLIQSIIEGTSDVIYAKDASGCFSLINRAGAQYLGKNAEEIIGKDDAYVFSYAEAQEISANDRQVMASAKIKTFEEKVSSANGVTSDFLSTKGPLFDGEGRVVGMFGVARDITEKKKADELIWQQANFDTLTGLPNRRMVLDRLEQDIRISKREGTMLSILFIDLDRFKEVNDSLGHEMGDALLIEAARRMRSCVRESDTVGRLGGDEFILLLGKQDDIGGVGRIANSLLQKLAQPFWLGEGLVYISGSIGITLYPDDAKDVVTLLKNADQAMYEAKRQGKNRFHFYTSSMQEASDARMLLTNDLHAAMRESQFVVYYQPIVELASGAIHKAEALIRWHHPTRGLVSPDAFIPLAEETGLIHEIGDWVFRQAAAFALRLHGKCHPEFQISVNKSPVQLRGGVDSLVPWFDHLLEIGLPTQKIVIEITESLLMEANLETTSLLLAFRDQGMQVALDDFGTGYSSLSYLKKFDIDYLKIDKLFISNLAPGSPDFVLCEAIIVMAHKLGLKVIAEGVETTEQRDLLKQIGCDYGQGYRFSRPVSSEAFEKLLSASG